MIYRQKKRQNQHEQNKLLRNSHFLPFLFAETELQMFYCAIHFPATGAVAVIALFLALFCFLDADQRKNN